MAQQTAVEWFYQRILAQDIKEAFDEGQEYEYQYHINSAPKFYSETYYNETYNK